MHSKTAPDLAALSSVKATARRDTAAVLRDIAGDISGGAIVAVVSIASAFSYAAVLFQGDLAGGLSTGLWVMLASIVIINLCLGLLTSMPPLAGGPDTPVIAVMGLLAAAVSVPVLALGAGPAPAVRHTLVAFSATTLLTGIVIYAIGYFRWGQSLRFVPYPLVGGFLAATGWLLMMSSLKVVTSKAVTLAGWTDAIPADSVPKVAAAVAFAAGLWFARKRIRSPLLMPVAFCGAAAILDLALWHGLIGDAPSWFIAGAKTLTPWLSPVAVAAPDIDWTIIAKAAPEMMTCVIVALISLVVKVSSLETSRSAAANIDQEFRATGIASLVGAPLGAITGGVVVGSSKLLVDAGGRTRFSSVVAGLITAVVVVAGLDLTAVVPTPILAGLLLLLGYSLMSEALRGAFKQRSWNEVALAVAIMLVCLRFGYVTGVLAGFVSACLMFAFSYGRVGGVRRHMTRASFSGAVERAPEIERLLRKEGHSIQVYVLSGFVFFGSSEAFFERVRAAVEAQSERRVRFLVLDFGGVTGVDSSAINTLAKLRGLCDKRDITLAYAGLAPSMLKSFGQAGLVGAGKRHRTFVGRTEALDWCEEQLLQTIAPASDGTGTDLVVWLSREFGLELPVGIAANYFERRELKDGELLYAQGAPADTIDFVTSGTLAITLTIGQGPPRRIRRSTEKTVLGEMGFFRGVDRGASISSEGAAVIYTLTRSNMDRLRSDKPDVYEAFLRFVIRILADRVDHANKEIAALS